MTELDDREALQRFATGGSEDAFRQLVLRYTDLVYGTAVRVTRDRSAAEEIAQNVFVALARKAAFLPADSCLGAWLHRSAVLEAKNWVRGEVRRKRREEDAGGLMMEREESILQPLAGALDDALLDLGEQDRAALFLRYLQQQPLREVGQTLGVSEDTAQKRVAKAVERLTRAFRKRGFAVSGAAVTVAVLEGSSHALPAGLINSILSSALGAAAPVASLSGLALLAAKFMALTKTQTITVCLLLGAAPVAYQWQAIQQANAANRQQTQALAARTSVLADVQARNAALTRELGAAQRVLVLHETERRRLLATERPALPPEDQLYAWSDDSEYVRLPKSVLAHLRLTPLKEQVLPNGDRRMARGEVVDEQGYVSPVLLEALGLDPNQTANVQGSFLNFAEDFQALVRAHTYRTNAMPPGIGFSRPPGTDLLTFRTTAFPEEGEELKARLAENLERIMGSERTQIVMEKQAASVLESEFLDSGRYEKWIAVAQQQDDLFTVARTKARDGISYGGSVTTVRYEQLPDELKPYFQTTKTE